MNLQFSYIVLLSNKGRMYQYETIIPINTRKLGVINIFRPSFDMSLSETVILKDS